MMTRNEALQQLATAHKYAQMTAGGALASLTQAFKNALEPRDFAFFEFHSEEPCHEVARAALAGHVWHGCDESQKQKPHWRKLEQEVMREVIRKG